MDNAKKLTTSGTQDEEKQNKNTTQFDWQLFPIYNNNNQNSIYFAYICTYSLVYITRVCDEVNMRA